MKNRVLAFLLLVSCASPEQFGANAAESAYTTALARCVDKATSLAESRACRKTVDAAYGITETESGR